MKRKDISMCERVAEEIYKLGDTNRGAARKIGCDHHRISGWLSGRSTPSAYHLKGMYEAGLDVIYILTGKRTR
jgi:transcriptional regulator with XRE-family HTH domain